MAEKIQGQDVVAAMRRACDAVLAQQDYLTSLDQALGDGDMGVTMGKLAHALMDYTEASKIDDLGKFLLGAGMAANRAAPSTMGTLTATALMRMGKVLKGKSELDADDLVAMFQAADTGIQERGKAKPGDKTIVDALHPASEAFAEAVAGGKSLTEAGADALQAAQAGLESVTPLRSKIGRASWVGERTIGKIDPGCAVFVTMLTAVLQS
jgi:dihydroxyacetone kinase